MFKVNNKDTRTTPSASLLCLFTVNFEHISHLVLVFLLLILNMPLRAGQMQCNIIIAKRNRILLNNIFKLCFASETVLHIKFSAIVKKSSHRICDTNAFYTFSFIQFHLTCSFRFPYCFSQGKVGREL